MSAIEDFLKNKLHVGKDTTDAVGFVEGAVGVVGSLSTIIGVPAAVMTILTKLGVFSQSDLVQTKLDSILSDFTSLFTILKAEFQLLHILEVGDKHDIARVQERVIREELGDPNFESQRGIVLNQSSVIVEQLGNIDHYERPFFPEEVHKDAWSGELPPPLIPGTAFILEYRVTLPAYLHCIQIRLEILSVLEPGFRSTHGDEFGTIAQRLEDLHGQIFDGFVPLRLPAEGEVLPQGPFPANGGDSFAVPSAWDSANRLYGVVERVSGIALIDSYPTDRFPNVPIAVPVLIPPNVNDLYKQFALQHQLRTLRRKKKLYVQLGLSSLWSILKIMKKFAGVDFTSATDFGRYWSMRELDTVVAVTLLGTPSVATVSGGKLSVSMTRLFAFLGAVRPAPVSFKTAIEQAMGEALLE